MKSVGACAFSAAAVVLAAGSVARGGLTWSVTSVKPLVAVDLVNGEPAFGGDPGFATGVGSSELLDGIKLFGGIDGTPQAMRLTGADLDTAIANTNGAPFFLLEIQAQALVDAPRANGDHFRVDWNFSIDFTGGVARWYSFGAGFGLFDNENGFLTGYGVSTGQGETELPPASHDFGGTFEYTFFESTNLGLFPTLARVDFTTSLVFKWTGYQPGDTFVLNIPDDSIDITVAPGIPGPGGAAAMGLLGLCAARRRRA